MTFKIKDKGLNEQIEWISKLVYFVQVKLTVGAVVFPAMLITLVNYFVFNKNDQSYFLPIPIMYVQNEMYLIFIKPSGDGKIIFLVVVFRRLPFNWRTPLGYLMATTFEFVSLFGIVPNIAPSACFAIGASVWVNSFVNDIAQDVNDMNAMHNHLKQQRDFNAMNRRFIAIIQDFSDAKEFSVSLNCHVFYCLFNTRLSVYRLEFPARLIDWSMSKSLGFSSIRC